MWLAQDSASLSVARGILNSAQRAPQATAIEAGECARTYAALAERLRKLGSAALNHYGLQPGDVVALLAPNRIEYLEIVAGLAEAGLCVATLNPRLSAEELRDIFQDCKPKLAIVDPSLASLVGESGDPEVPTIILGDDYEAVLAAASPCAFPELDERSAFSISYTSGTTGKPKGVLLPHRSRALVCLASAVEYECFGMGDRFLALAPMYHGAGLAFALAAVSHGGTCIIHESNDAESIVARLEQGDIHGVFMVPTHFKRIFDLPESRLEGLASRHQLKAIISNAAALAPRFKELTCRFFGEGLLHETYGSTEAGIVTNMRPEHLLDRLESVGTPFIGMEIEIRRADGSLCDAGEVGELYARGPYTFVGYLNRPDETAAALQDGWVTVQDLAVRDDDGFINIVGRSKDMVVSGGVNIYPAEIEKVIAQEPSVAEVAVVGLPDDEWGESVHAFVVLRLGNETDAENIIARCRQTLSGYKVPRGVTFIDELPRNASGKILKKDLRAGAAVAPSEPRQAEA